MENLTPWAAARRARRGATVETTHIPRMIVTRQRTQRRGTNAWRA
jgi:hypothetical protein